MQNHEPQTYFSYAEPDAEFARRLARDLKRLGADLWVEGRHVGSDLDTELARQAALITARQYVVVLSPSSVTSPNILGDLSWVIEQKQVLSVLYRDCAIPPKLKDVPGIDFRGKYGPAFRQLLAAIRADEVGVQAVTRRAGG